MEYGIKILMLIIWVYPKFVNTEINPGICVEDTVKINSDLFFKLSEKPVVRSERPCSNITIDHLSLHDRLNFLDILNNFIKSRVSNIDDEIFWLPLNGFCSGNLTLNHIKDGIFHTNTSCNPGELHHSVCIFRNSERIIQSICPNNYKALIYDPNVCYGVEGIESDEFCPDVSPVNAQDYYCKLHIYQEEINIEGIFLAKMEVSPIKHTFAGMLDLPCNVTTCQLISNNKKELRKLAKKELKLLFSNENRQRFPDLLIYNVKIFSTESFTDDSMKLWVLYHIDASLKDSEEFNQLGDDDGSGAKAFFIKTLFDNLTIFLKNSINSTQNCLFDSTSSNIWPQTRIGETSRKQAQTRRCIGDLMYGAVWDEPEELKKAISIFDIYNPTKYQRTPDETAENVKEILRNNISSLVPVDIFYLSKIVETVFDKELTTTDGHNLTKAAIDMLAIYNAILSVDKSVLKASNTINSTNVLLYKFEKFFDELAINTEAQSDPKNSESRANDKVEYRYSEGNQAYLASKLKVFLIDPKVANISGVAIYEFQSNNTDKTNNNSITFKFLYSNQSIEKLLEEDNLQIASYIPEILLNKLYQISNDPPVRVVVKYFSNDVLFQETQNGTNKQVYKSSISVSIPGHNGNLPELVPLIMRVPANETNEEFCAFWNYTTWSKVGIRAMSSRRDKHLIVCGTEHLTPFAYLVGKENFSESNQKALNIITLIGCLLSLIGVKGIFITALALPKWRKQKSTKIILQLSLGIGMQMITFCFINTENTAQELVAHKKFWTCVTLGASLQYSMLVQFSWMMIIAFLQFYRYVKVYGGIPINNLFMKCFLIGWIVPLIPVLLVVLLDPESFVPPADSKSGLCYPKGLSLYLGICLPVAILVVGNVSIYICVMKSIYSKKIKPTTKNTKALTLSKIRVSIWLFFQLGLAWIFGLLSAMDDGVIFSYLFSITASIQGVVMFVYFVIMNPVPRTMLQNNFVNHNSIAAGTEL